jgi:predicted RNA methylase
VKEAIKEKIRETRLYNLLGDRVVRLRGRFFDWRHNVETAIEVDVRKLKIDSLNKDHAVSYVGTDPKSLAKLLKDIHIEFEKFVFVDLGSGKGRVLLMASEYPFKKITGVEFSSELHEIALKNIKSYKNPARKCSNIESIHEDAARFTPPEEPTVFYLFNPFRPQVLEKVIENVEKSFRENPREIYFIYANPLHEEILKNSPIFRQQRADVWYSIYKTI